MNNIVEFSDCIGDFHFSKGNIGLDLWKEFSECVGDGLDNERLWLVESGDRVLFNTNIIQNDDISYEIIEKFCDWLNQELVQKKWKDIKIDVLGKIIFYNDWDHDIIVLVFWKDGKFQIKSHDFFKM